MHLHVTFKWVFLLKRFWSNTLLVGTVVVQQLGICPHTIQHGTLPEPNSLKSEHLTNKEFNT